jgi:hypothetical protein
MWQTYFEEHHFLKRYTINLSVQLVVLKDFFAAPYLLVHIEEKQLSALLAMLPVGLKSQFTKLLNTKKPLWLSVIEKRKKDDADELKRQQVLAELEHIAQQADHIEQQAVNQRVSERDALRAIQQQSRLRELLRKKQERLDQDMAEQNQYRAMAEDAYALRRRREDADALRRRREGIPPPGPRLPWLGPGPWPHPGQGLSSNTGFCRAL